MNLNLNISVCVLLKRCSRAAQALICRLARQPECTATIQIPLLENDPKLFPGAGAQRLSPSVWAKSASVSAVNCVAASAVVRGLGWDSSPVLWVEMAKKWHNIKNKKQICLCPSLLPGIKRFSFQHLALRGLTHWLDDCSHSVMPRLLGRVYTTPAF